MIPLPHVLVLSATLFVIGAAGFVFRKNIVTVFMCIELMLNAVNLAFIGFSRYLGNLDGQLFAFFVIVVAAAEAGWAWPSSSPFIGTATRSTSRIWIR